MGNPMIIDSAVGKIKTLIIAMESSSSTMEPSYFRMNDIVV